MERVSIRRCFLCVSLIAALFTLAGMASGQASPCATTVTVTPYSAIGDRVAPLTLAKPDLQARVNGEHVTVTSLKAQDEPLRFILVIDGSGSMQTFDSTYDRANVKWQIVMELAQKIVKATESGSKIGILAFSGKDEWSFPVTDDKSAILSALKQVPEFKGKQQKTPLWDTIKQAESILQPRSGNDALIILSDGEDNASKESMEKLEPELARMNLRLFAITFLDARTIDEFAGPRGLRTIAENTGGFATELNFAKLHQERPDVIEQAFESTAKQIVALAGGSYEVSVEMKDRMQKAGKLSFKAANKKANLLYPRVLPPCAAQ